MKISFTGADIKTKVQNYKQKQDAKIIENLQAERSRKSCNIGFFGFTSALVGSFVAPSITKQLLTKTNLNIHPLSLDARVGMGIIAIGLLSGTVFNKIDEKKPTKLGDFLYKLNNRHKTTNEIVSKVDIKA